MVGAIALQGGHQDAQKSTKTGTSEPNTSFSKDPSVKFNVCYRLPWNYAKCGSSIFFNSGLGLPPTICSTGLPPLNRISVGMD